MSWLSVNWPLAASLVANVVSTVGLALSIRYHCNSDKKAHDAAYMERGRQIQRADDLERRIAALESRSQ